jgi:nitrite reductase/ring-hydroxylating ferredoxin subunit/DMSO/TMAO reductase YedYZ heme-binding membrane subunit
MSHSFVPVQWNKQKINYDLILIAGIFVYLACFIGVGLKTNAADLAILIIRGLGTCAIVLLHFILAIGPLARLSDRFKPLLYNRRHFGVTMALIALGHGVFTLMWYHGAGTINPIASAIGGYGDYGVAIDFPFESLGLFALIILLVMAATSHDFWLAKLSPPVWKALHMSVYFAYAALVGHVALGTAQFDKGSGLLWAITLGAGTITALHFAAMFKGRSLDKNNGDGSEWHEIGDPMEIPLNKAVTFTPVTGERVAVFRHAKGISAIDAVCSHQNGPLGEGCVLDGLITCPWHGFQFDPETGEAPAPFEDKVKTHEVKIENGSIFVRVEADDFGTTRKSVKVTS